MCSRSTFSWYYFSVCSCLRYFFGLLNSRLNSNLWLAVVSLHLMAKLTQNSLIILMKGDGFLCHLYTRNWNLDLLWQGMRVPSGASLMVYLQCVSSLRAVVAVEMQKSRKSPIEKNSRETEPEVWSHKAFQLGLSSVGLSKLIMYLMTFLKRARINVANSWEWSMLKACRWGALEMTCLCLYSEYKFKIWALFWFFLSVLHLFVNIQSL